MPTGAARVGVILASVLVPGQREPLDGMPALLSALRERPDRGCALAHGSKMMWYALLVLVPSRRTVLAFATNEGATRRAEKAFSKLAKELMPPAEECVNRQNSDPHGLRRVTRTAPGLSANAIPDWLISRRTAARLHRRCLLRAQLAAGGPRDRSADRPRLG